MYRLGGRLTRFRARRHARKRARSLAEDLCRRLRPDEPILGTVLCADEDARYVARVFCGRRPEDGQMLPPWRECFIIAVAKECDAVAELVEDCGSYWPIIR